ncbi:MAG: hypothetical protein ACTSRK_12780 [Promethearchaeota archaeon]
MKNFTLKTWKIILFSTIFLMALGFVFSLNGLEFGGIAQFNDFVSSIGILEKTAGGGGGLPSLIGILEKTAGGGGGLPSLIGILEKTAGGGAGLP